MNYLFITKSEFDPATRYRVWPIADRLREQGHLVELVSSKMHNLSILVKVKKADIVVIQRKLFSNPTAKMIAHLAKRLIYDFDDAIFLKSNGEISLSRDKRFQTVASAADCIWAGNDFLAAKAKAYCAQVKVIPTPVDTEKYHQSVAREKEAVFTLVWIGSSSTRKYLQSHKSIFENLGKSVADIQLKVISDFEFHLDNLKVVNKPWSAETEIAELKSSHLGIAPMEDNPWTKGKCALKVIQYMAASLPVISSPVGANAEVIVDGETGILALNAEDWRSGVEFFRDSPVAASKMGEKGRQRAEDLYSKRVVVNKLVEDLDD